MKTQRKLLIRLLVAALALLTTITWVDVAEASTTYPATTIESTSIDLTTPVVPASKPIYTLFSVGWGGGQ
jgi:hypothetical protein